MVVLNAEVCDKGNYFGRDNSVKSLNQCTVYFIIYIFFVAPCVLQYLYSFENNKLDIATGSQNTSQQSLALPYKTRLAQYNHMELGMLKF